MEGNINKIINKINTLMTFTSLPARFSSFIVVQFMFVTNSFITLMLPMVIENKLKYLTIYE